MKLGKRIFVVGAVWSFAALVEAKPSLEKPVVCLPATVECQPLIMLPDFDKCPKEEVDRPHLAVRDGGGEQPCLGIHVKVRSDAPGTAAESTEK